MDKEQLVLSWLNDEESRFIFEKRLSYNKSGDFSYIREIVEKCLPQFAERNYYPDKIKELKKELQGNGMHVFFGAGARLEEICAIWENDVLPVDVIVDNNVALWGTQYRGIDIVAPASVVWEKVDKVVVIPGRQDIAEAISEQLLGYGVNKESIVVCNDYSSVSDEEAQYFDGAIIKWKENELFVDGGAHDLRTSIYFTNYCKQAGVNGKILAFEPDELIYEKSKRLLETDTSLSGEIVNAGLWSHNTTLYFNLTHRADGRIVDEKTDTSINVVAVDEYIEEPITFIKMDIEGAELEALKGCQEVIKKYKPKLAISVYHKTEDIITLPLYIKELVPEYKLYMRHYSDSAAETVLYAVAE